MDQRTLDKKLQFIEDYKKASNAATGSQVDPNANVTVKNIATEQCELGKKDIIDLRRAIVCDYLKKADGQETADAYLADLKNHRIYAHDETSLFPYCCSISLYPFVLNGLKDLGGSSCAPKHANGFIGGLINLIFSVASQFAGAVAIPEFLTYFDHFLRVDYGQGYISRLDETLEVAGGESLTLRRRIEDWFQQFVYSINQPAGARNYQSPFTNIAYFDKYYFESIFKDFVFPDGDEPKWETTRELQKMFMKWFNAERSKEVLTFPVETANILVDKETHEYKDAEMADFFAGMWAEGHSFFMYQSDSVDALASCCFSKDTKVLARSCVRGKTKIYFDTFENIGKTQDGPDRWTFDVFHNGSWCAGAKVKLPSRPMFKITTANNKELIVSDNHLNPTMRGDVVTTSLTTDDYLLFSNRPLDAVPEQDLHLTFEQGFAIGAFLGDGRFGALKALKNGSKVIYDTIYSQNIDKYATCMDMVNAANKQLGGDSACAISKIVHNVYPVRLSSKRLVSFIVHNVCHVRLSSKQLVSFISYWTNWKRGTNAFTKELNMECLLQSVEFRRGILMGWYSTDGGNSNRCRTVSKKLANCMECLLTSLGMSSVITSNDRTAEEKTYICGAQINHNGSIYTVQWYDMKNKRSMNGIYKVFNNSVYFKIKSIVPVVYNDDIYCFEMANKEEPYFTLPNGVITHNCRLRNSIESNVFSYTLGAGGIQTGSKCVITLNLNRITQDWDRSGRVQTLPEYLTPIVKRVHSYLNAWNAKLWDDFNAGLLPVYKAGFIDLDKQYLTVGVNGFIDGAETLGIKADPDDPEYRKFAHDVLGTIKALNAEDRTEHSHFNTEMTPSENAGAKLYAWDRRDGYKVNPDRNLYNSYFYPVEDPTIDPVRKFYYQGEGFASECDGGVALHNNLDESLSKSQYRHLMDVAVRAGCNYFTYNVVGYQCSDCGYISKSYGTSCRKCGSKNIDYYTRIIGYLKKVSNFSDARQAEFKKRYLAHGLEGVKKNIGE